MNGPDILSAIRADLAQQVQHHIPDNPEPLDVSPWLAMALLQKAIRRGHRQFALQAAATLVQQSHEGFWRRCGVIAFEDVGVSDLPTVSLVIASLAGKTFRSRIGGEWRVASFIVERLVNAPKCRAADDLLMFAERHPALEKTRLDLTYATMPELLRIADSNTPLPRRALAFWYAVGTDRCPSPHLRTRRGDPQTVFDTMCEAGLPHTLVEVAREGFRRTSQVLCPLVVLISTLKAGDPTSVEDDDFPLETMSGPIPSWALDRYSREGQHALQRLLRRDCMTARWVHRHIPSSQQINFLGDILFAVEGGLLRNHHRWPVADELRRSWEIECQGPHCTDATEIISLLRADISLLNEERQHVL
ncbi:MULTISPECIES: hypothetical protein [unclassified Mesorhizobium]|uniref:hypothetical protein n=1 Tax=unclassified Mesorhizobium TaxID=325217 RepID=UPI00333A7581